MFRELSNEEINYIAVWSRLHYSQMTKDPDRERLLCAIRKASEVQLAKVDKLQDDCPECEAKRKMLRQIVEVVDDLLDSMGINSIEHFPASVWNSWQEIKEEVE